LPDHAAFERLVMVHLDAGYNLARWLTHDVRDAEDVVQDACLRAMKYMDTLHAEDGRAWFLTIVRRAFYDWLARNRPALLVRDDESAIEALADEADNPEQALARKSERLALAEAVAALPLPFREVIVLRELEDLSYKEIARIADVPVGTVMSRLSRARRLLQGAAALRGFEASGTGGDA
jgi:RNA polymerase sigma-70 factor (ECF subfamily)